MNKLKMLSKVLFILGSLIAVASIGFTAYLQKTAPAGFCPVNPMRPYMGAGIVLLVSSMMIDYYLYLLKRRNGRP